MTESHTPTVNYTEESLPKYAVVTGGSEGIGFAIAEMLVRHDFHVMLLARDITKLEVAREKLGHEHVSIFSCDVSEAESVKRVRLQIGGVTQSVDVLVNAAGTFRWDPSEINLMQVNAESKKLMMDAFANLLDDDAWVVNVSSQAAGFVEDDPRRVGEEGYVLSMKKVEEYSEAFKEAHANVRVHVTRPPLMKGKIAEQQFRGREGFEDVDFDALPGPEIVAEEVERVMFSE